MVKNVMFLHLKGERLVKGTAIRMVPFSNIVVGTQLAGHEKYVSKLDHFPKDEISEIFELPPSNNDNNNGFRKKTIVEISSMT